MTNMEQEPGKSPVIDTTDFARGYRTRFQGGKSDRTWMPENVTVLVFAKSTGTVLLLKEKKPGVALNFGDGETRVAKSFSLGGQDFVLEADEVLTLPSGSLKNNWEGAADNVEPLHYAENWRDAAVRQLKGETGKVGISPEDIVDLFGAYVKPANMPTFDRYACVALPEEFTMATVGLDPTIKGGLWVPAAQAVELVLDGTINHCPACQAILRAQAKGLLT